MRKMIIFLYNFSRFLNYVSQELCQKMTPEANVAALTFARKVQTGSDGYSHRNNIVNYIVNIIKDSAQDEPSKFFTG